MTTTPATALYEALLELAVDFDHAADKMREGLDPEANDGPADEIADECAKVYEEAHQRIAAILNASPLADTEGSASSQHYIETGVRLPIEDSFSTPVEESFSRPDRVES